MPSKIPQQLKDARLIRVEAPLKDDKGQPVLDEDGKPLGGKKPIGLKWNLLGGANYAYDDSKLMQHLAKGGNVGVVCGITGLAVLDVDEPELAAVAKKLPPTFAVGTGKGEHLYYECTDFGLSMVLELDGKHCGEIQAMDAKGGGRQVVCPPSVHASGKEYVVLRDLPIASITREELLAVVSDFVPSPWKKLEEEAATAKGHEDDIELDIMSVVDTTRLTRKGSEWQGPHPVHGSKTGQNFTVNPSKNLWHCFRHNTGGGPLSWLAVRDGVIDCSDARPGALRGEKFLKTKERAQELGLMPKDEPRKPPTSPTGLRVEDGFLSGRFMIGSGTSSSTELVFAEDGVFKDTTRYMKNGFSLSDSVLLSNYRLRIKSTNRLGRDYGTGISQFLDCELVAKNGSTVPFNDQIASLPAFINQQGRGIPRGLEKLGLAITSLADDNVIPSSEGAPAFGLFPGENGKVVFADGVKIPVLAQYPAARDKARALSDSLAKPRGTVAEYAAALVKLDSVYSKVFPELMPIIAGWNGCVPLAFILRREVGLFPHLGLEGGRNLGKSMLALAFTSAYGNSEESSGETLRSPFRMSAVLGAGIPSVINEGEGLGSKDFPAEILKNAATQTVATSRGTSDLGMIPMLSCGGLTFTSNVGLVSFHGDAGGALSDRMPTLLYPEGRLRDGFRENEWELKRLFDEAVKQLGRCTAFGAEYLRWLAGKNTSELTARVNEYEALLMVSPALIGRKPKAYAEIYLGITLLREFLTGKQAPIAPFLNLDLATFQQRAEAIEGSDRIPTTEGYAAACLLAELIGTHDSGVYMAKDDERTTESARAIEAGRDGIFYNGGQELLVTTKGLEWLNRENSKRYGLGTASSLTDLRDKLANAWKAEGLLPPQEPSSHRWGKETFRAVKLVAKDVLKVANRTGSQAILDVTVTPDVTQNVTKTVEVKPQNVMNVMQKQVESQFLTNPPIEGAAAFSPQNQPLPEKDRNSVTKPDSSSKNIVTKSVTEPVTNVTETKGDEE